MHCAGGPNVQLFMTTEAWFEVCKESLIKMNCPILRILIHEDALLRIRCGQTGKDGTGESLFRSVCSRLVSQVQIIFRCIEIK